MDDPVIVLRMAERALLILVIVVASVAMMFVYRKKIQEIDFSLSSSGISGKTNLSLAMPIFILLSLIALCYIVFNSKVDFSNEKNHIDNKNTTKFVGFTSGARSEDRKLLLSVQTVIDAYDRIRAGERQNPNERISEFSMEIAKIGAARKELEKLRFNILASHFSNDLVAQCEPWRPWGEEHQVSEDCREIFDYLGK